MVSDNPQILVSGFTDRDIRVLEISEARRPVMLSDTHITGRFGQYQVSFTAPSGTSSRSYPLMAATPRRPDRVE